MGWLWSSGPAPTTTTRTTTTKDTPQDTSTTITERQSAPKAAEPPAYSDPEIAKFMAQLQAEFSSDRSPPKPPTQTTVPNPSAADASLRSPEAAPATSSSSSSSWWPSSRGPSAQPTQSTTPPTSTISHQTIPSAPPPSSAQTPQRLDPVSEALLPTSMSCRQAFDAAFHCNSLGGQWLSVYREGGVRSCSEKWDDFWFCMRTRAYAPGSAKDDAVRDHYRRKELARYHGPGKPSSLDVWEPRTELLPPGSAFAHPYVRPDVGDEEWRRREIEHWRAVRQALEAEEEAASASR